MKKKILFGLVGVGLVLVLYQAFLSQNSQPISSKTHPVVKEGLQSLDQKLNSRVSFNLLLLGYGGAGHDGEDLTDSIILAHFDPKNKIISLISIPRDLWVKIPTSGKDGSYWKINTAFTIGMDDQNYPKKDVQFRGEMGGGNLAKHEVQTITGLFVDKFLAVDFQGFVDMVNALGGVDVNIEKNFDDFEYPAQGHEDDLCGHSSDELPNLEKIASSSVSLAFPCRFEHLHFDQGQVHMDGETALKFARSRHSLQDGTDFGRSGRQKELLLAVKGKIYNLNIIPKLFFLISTLRSNFKTDLTADDIKTLLVHSSQLQDYQIKSLALTNQNFLTEAFSEDGQSILLPNQGLGEWREIRNFLSENLDNSTVIISPIIKVENGTNVAGLAELATNHLKDEDLNLLPAGSSSQSDLNKTTIQIFSPHIDQDLIDGLKDEFRVSEVKTYSLKNQPYDILITVGKDYYESNGKKIIN